MFTGDVVYSRSRGEVSGHRAVDVRTLDAPSGDAPSGLRSTREPSPVSGTLNVTGDHCKAFTVSPLKVAIHANTERHSKRRMTYFPLLETVSIEGQNPMATPSINYLFGCWVVFSVFVFVPCAGQCDEKKPRIRDNLLMAMDLTMLFVSFEYPLFFLHQKGSVQHTTLMKRPQKLLRKREGMVSKFKLNRLDGKQPGCATDHDNVGCFLMFLPHGPVL